MSAEVPAERVTRCVWCDKEITTTRPWRPGEYQIHTACLPALDEYQAAWAGMIASGLDRAIADMEKRPVAPQPRGGSVGDGSRGTEGEATGRS